MKRLNINAIQCILCKCSIVGDALDHRGEDGEPEAKAFDLPVDL